MLSPYKPSNVQRISEAKIIIKGKRKILSKSQLNKKFNSEKIIKRKCKKIQYYF